eukprot:CAMPEP_0185032574 /NCGR_PEP_ID=MMETSP1103-20130426/20746_1 /TAXON_ID=36769 /ORGANISM="Paraphysomonas bandaiensis, Strain Caron Lab Isolate" /LENGTH=366 /DNA_ID=CAMNT_0027568523 /DNA_START=222 /DNA_END=1322 /DNA_ORIENTATION=+
MMGFTILLISYPMMFAVKRHNRFVLLLCFVIESVVFAQLVSVGLNCYTPTVPIFPAAMKEDCASNIPKDHTEEECAVYWESDRTAGFRLVWSAMFTKIGNEDFYQIMSTLEDDNLCCGFGPPLRCVNDTRPYPSDRPVDGLRSRMQDNRLICGQVDGYYRHQKNCIDFFDENTVPKILGGCEYDLGAGSCLDFEVIGDSIGCAAYVEEYVASQVLSNALVVMGSSFIVFLSLLIDCCMYWKRKESDVFPDFIHVEKKKSKWSNYHRIKDNVVVVPTKDYLYKRGFLPEQNMRPVLIQDEEEKIGDLDNVTASEVNRTRNSVTGPNRTHESVQGHVKTNASVPDVNRTKGSVDVNRTKGSVADVDRT